MKLPGIAIVLLLLSPLAAAGAGKEPAVAPVQGKQAVLEQIKRGIESTDFRATSRLVKIAADGQRSNYKLTIKGHWFPDGLRVMFDITDPAPARQRVLLHLGPTGHTTIEVAKAGAPQASVLPFEKWNDSVLGTDFNYEDLTDGQFFWKDQDLMESAKYGARDCFVLKSQPGADDKSHYASVVSWIDRTIFYPVHIVKTLRGAAAQKEVTSEGLRETGGVWSASQIEVKMTGKPGSSLLVIERGSAKANLGRKDFDFNQPSAHGEE